MNTGTYGLGTSIRGPGGSGAGLTGLGQSQQRDATALLGAAADAETNRNIQNEQLEAQKKQSNTSMGASAGAMAGTMIMPGWGTVIGGLVGALAGSQM